MKHMKHIGEETKKGGYTSHFMYYIDIETAEENKREANPEMDGWL